MGNPVLAARNVLKHDTGIAFVVERELGAVQETTVADIKLVGNIPVEEGDERGNASVEEVVDKLAVVIDTCLVNGVVSATERDDSRPADGETVGLGANRLEKSDILSSAVVRVAGGDTRAAVSNLAGLVTEHVPVGNTTAILVNGALNLVTAKVVN